MELKEGLLAYTEIESSSKYKSESETNTSSTLLLYTLLLSTLLPLSLLISLLLLPSYNISQYDINLEQIVCQQQKKIVALQVLIAQAELKREKGVLRLNTRASIKVAKP